LALAWSSFSRKSATRSASAASARGLTIRHLPASGLARQDLGERDDRRLGGLLREDPGARGTLAADEEAERSASFGLHDDLRLGGLEPELVQRCRARRHFAVHPGGGEAGDDAVHGPAVGPRLHRLEQLPARVGALEADGLALPLDRHRLDVLRLEIPEPILHRCLLLARGLEPVGVVVVETAQSGEEEDERGDRDPAAQRRPSSASGGG
jgi:hypothetical protein